MKASGPNPLPRRFRVGNWLVEGDTCILSRGQKKRHLRPLLIDLLTALAERAGQVVTKDEILQRVWSGRFVSESVLTRTMAELRKFLGEHADAPQTIETIPRRGYRLVAAVEWVGGAAEPRLAVLPFENLNRDPEQDYFTEGISDALITELGCIPSLRVISRQSVLRYKGSGKALPEIARELKVSAIVEGSALRCGSHVRITAQLIQAEPEQHLWARSYEGELSDILQLQARVARAIAESVQAVLTPKQLERLSRPRSATNPEAYLAYLKGRYYLSHWTRDSIAKGFEYLHQAIAIDPSCAPAYVQLAEGLVVLGYWGQQPSQAYKQARAAVSKALEIEDSQSGAHTLLGVVCWLLDWDFERCEREMQRGIELNPSLPLARLFYANFLVTMRDRREAAIREAEIALELDPLSANTNFTFAYKLVFAGQYERAAAQALSTLQLYPDCLHALYVLGWAEIGRGRYASAVAAFEKAVAMSPDLFSLAYLAHALGRSGNIDEARSILDELMVRRAGEHIDEIVFFIIYSGLGDLDVAFESAEKCFAERDSRLFWLQVVPCFEPLRVDPRFHNLARRLGLPPLHKSASVGAGPGSRETPRSSLPNDRWARTRNPTS
jgi:TolB-like protein